MRFVLSFFVAVSVTTAQAASTDDYQIGETWGKVAIAAADLENLPRPIRRTALATGRLGGGTTFYLGMFSGSRIIATNHHVCPTARSCSKVAVRFPLLGVVAQTEQLLGTWPEIDLALLTVKVSSPADGDRLDLVALNFDWKWNFKRGETLATLGFGHAGNSARAPVLAMDEDCRIFSGDNEFRLLADPDEFNPADYRAWSFSSGCDISHGDSGSSVIDRETGSVIGIMWTGRIPKSPQVRQKTFLEDLLRSPSEAIWTLMNFGVPAPKMYEFLQSWLGTGNADPVASDLIEDLLAHGGGPA